MELVAPPGRDHWLTYAIYIRKSRDGPFKLYTTHTLPESGIPDAQTQLYKLRTSRLKALENTESPTSIPEPWYFCEVSLFAVDLLAPCSRSLHNYLEPEEIPYRTLACVYSVWEDVGEDGSTQFFEARHPVPEPTRLSHYDETGNYIGPPETKPPEPILIANTKPARQRIDS